MSNIDSHSPRKSRSSRKREPLFFHPQETLILCVASALDVVMTYYLLARSGGGFTESNPIARYFLYSFGFKGMAYFKGTMTIFVCVLTQIIARKNSDLARQVLGLATVIVVAVVVYSVWLHFNHRPIAETIEAHLPTRIDAVFAIHL